MKFSSISRMIDFALAARDRKKYDELRDNPESAEREQSTRFGKKAIFNAVVAALLPLIPLGLIYLFISLLNAEAIAAGAVIFWVIAIIAIIAGAVAGAAAVGLLVTFLVLKKKKKS